MAAKKFAVRMVMENGRRVKAEIEGIGKAGEASFQRMSQQVDTAGIALSRLARLAVGALSIRQVVDYTNRWADMRTSLAQATGSMEAGGAVLDRLAQVARRTTSELGTTVDGFLAFSTTLRELGLSTRQQLDFVETLSTALDISGKRGAEAERVQQALSRAMMLGTLSGTNLTTVLQNGGRVTQALADSMGVATTDLLELGRAGKITRADILGITSEMEKLRDEAGSSLSTIADGFRVLGNAALQLVGTWDTVIGGSGMIAEALMTLADNLEHVAVAAASLGAFMAGRWVVSFVAARGATAALTMGMVALRGAIIRTGIGALVVGAGELIYWFGKLVTGAGGFGNALKLAGDVAAEVFDRIKIGLGGVGQAFSALVKSIRFWWAELLLGMQRKLYTWGHGAASILARVAATLNPNRSYEDIMSEVPSVDEALERIGAGEASAAAADDAAAAWAKVGATWNQATQPLQSLPALMEALANQDATDALDEAGDSAARIASALDRAGGAGRAVAAAASGAAEGWAKVAEDLDKYADSAMDFAAGIGEAISNAFQTAESAIRTFAEGGKVSVKDMVRSMLADLAVLAWRSSILGPLAKAVGGAISGQGFMNTLAEVWHSGGIVGTGGAGRMVPAMAFAGAERFHGGGWPGLRPDEVPAILQRGERVLSRREVAQGAGGAQNINISVNVEGASGDQHVISLVTQGVTEGLKIFDRSLPGRVRQINANPRVR